MVRGLHRAMAVVSTESSSLVPVDLVQVDALLLELKS